MTEQHHTGVLVNDWRNNIHSSGKMEIGGSIRGSVKET